MAPASSSSNSNNNNDFLARAQAATNRVAASASVQQNATPEQTRIVQELAQDRPTIHAAVTSFLSLVAARSLVERQSPADKNKQPQNVVNVSSSNSNKVIMTNPEALKCSRTLLKTINKTTMSAIPSTNNTNSGNNAEEEYSLVAQLWNGLIASEQKPSRFLGRRALQHAWSDVKSELPLPNSSNTNVASNDDDNNNDEEQKFSQFIQEFERLLYQPTASSGGNNENDAALLWDADGGQKELEKRREERQKRANENEKAEEEAKKNQEQQQQEEQESKSSPMIEELPPDES